MKLIIESVGNGAYFYQETEAHHKKVEPTRSGNRKTMKDLGDECLVDKGDYIVLDVDKSAVRLLA